MTNKNVESINVVDKNSIEKEINAQKINIVDKDGNIKMALFSKGNVPPAIMDGKDLLPGHRQSDPISGIFFYNGEGDECGGLIFGNEKNDDGDYFSGASLTFDQYKQDQIVQILYDDQNGVRKYGINIFDKPKEPITEFVKKSAEIEEMEDGPEKQAALKDLYKGSATRMFMGKDSNGDVGIKMNDSQNRERIRILIDQGGVPRIELLDAEGNILYSLPPED